MTDAAIGARREALWKGIDEARLRRILVESVDIYSPSGKEEDVQLYYEELLTRHGLPVQRQEVEEAERYNLRAVLGEGPPKLYFIGHVDTVAAWDLEEFGAVEEGHLVHGLGTADMKGGCAAMIETFLSLAALPESERPPVGLLLVVGEEENGDGSALFLQKERPPWVVIGEPTSLGACFSHFGYLEVELETRGRRIHSSLPELGHNAVESMLRVLLHLGREPLFDRESSGVVYSIRDLSSARAGFVVPDRCEATIDMHLPPAVEPAAVEESIRRQLAGARHLVPDLALEVAFNFQAPGYHLEPDNPLSRVLEEIYPQLGVPLRFEPFRSHSDGNLFFQEGVNPLILGPGALEVAHTPDEQISFAEVLTASRIYAALALAAHQL